MVVGQQLGGPYRLLLAVAKTLNGPPYLAWTSVGNWAARSGSFLGDTRSLERAATVCMAVSHRVGDPLFGLRCLSSDAQLHPVRHPPLDKLTVLLRAVLRRQLHCSGLNPTRQFTMRFNLPIGS